MDSRGLWNEEQGYTKGASGYVRFHHLHAGEDADNSLSYGFPSTRE